MKKTLFQKRQAFLHKIMFVIFNLAVITTEDDEGLVKHFSQHYGLKEMNS